MGGFSQLGQVLSYGDGDRDGWGGSSWLMGGSSKSGVVLMHGDGD